jgi:hypothetical protein
MDISELSVGTEIVLINFDSFSNRSRIVSAKVSRITKTRVTFQIRENFEKVYVIDKFGRVSKEVGQDSYRSDHVFLAGSQRHKMAVYNNVQAKLLSDVSHAGHDLYQMSGSFVDEQKLAAAEEAIAALREHLAQKPQD